MAHRLLEVHGGGGRLVQIEDEIEGRFKDFFKTATGDGKGANGPDPYPFQKRLATCDRLPELIDIPTGLGKTDAVVLALAEAVCGAAGARCHAPKARLLPAHEGAGGAAIFAIIRGYRGIIEFKRWFS